MTQIARVQRPLRLVLDTHVVLEMLLWHSPRHAPLLDSQKAGACVFLVDAATLDEFERVLAYSVLMLDAAQQAQVYVRYLACAIPQVSLEAPADLPRCKDVNDQKFLELSYSADAFALITRDKKLLKIGKNKRYRQRFLTTTPELLGTAWLTATALV